MSLKYNLFPEELKFLFSIAKKAKLPKENNNMDITSRFMAGEAQDFLEMFSKNRSMRKSNIKPVLKALDIRLCHFGTVPMHTDCLSGPKFKTFIVFIKGNGLLSHFKSKKDLAARKVTETYLTGMECFTLDDELPHSYTNLNKNKSLAIIADLPLTWLNMAKINENNPQ